MRAKAGGSFATLLLSIPLSAIPLMAIFGVPEFGHLAASTEEPIPDIVRQPAMSFLSDSTETSSTAVAANSGDEHPSHASPAPGEEVRTWGDGTPTMTPDESVQPSSPTSRFRDVTAVEPALPRQPSPRPMQTAAPVSMTPSDTARSAVAPLPTNSGLTWQAAARKLEESGISNYRLERGQSSDQFLFVCLFCPGGDHRITQRFEAEANEPLAAVEDVLGQVDRWLQHRHAQNQAWLQ